MEPSVSLLHSHLTDTCSYTEPPRSSLCLHIPRPEDQS